MHERRHLLQTVENVVHFAAKIPMANKPVTSRPKGCPTADGSPAPTPVAARRAESGYGGPKGAGVATEQRL